MSISFEKLWKKKSTKLFLLILFLFVIIFSNDIYSVPSLFNSESIIDYELPEFGQETINQIGIIIPFILFILLVFLLDYYYLNFISNKRSRRLIKVLLYVMLIFEFSLIYIEVAEFDIQLPELENTSDITGTFTTTGTEPYTSAPSGPPFSSVSLFNVFNRIFDLIQGMLPFIIIIILFVIATMYNLRRNMHFKDKNQTISTKNLEFNPLNVSEQKRSVINKYIEISEYLESRGVSSDFSLTPKEFEVDASEKYNRLKQILDEITEIYEVARFSENEITEGNIKRMEYLISLVKIEFEPYNNF